MNRGCAQLVKKVLSPPLDHPARMLPPNTEATEEIRFAYGAISAKEVHYMC